MEPTGSQISFASRFARANNSFLSDRPSMASLFVFVLSLNFMCQAIGSAVALPIPQRASLPHLEAPRAVALEMGFQSLFTMGESPPVSIHPLRIPDVLGQLCCSPFWERT